MPVRRLLAVAVLAGAVLAGAGCGGGGSDVGDERAAQVRSAAERAGLPAEVAGVLALAARADSAAFQVAYAGDDGARLVVSQDPPDRRVDVVQGDVVVESRVLRGGVGYRCEPAPGPGAEPGELSCRRAASSLEATGTFTEEALADFTEQLAASRDGLDLLVTTRTLAGVEATCLTSTPKAGTPLDGTGPGTDELCLSKEGAQLLVDHGGQRLVADRYTTKVPKGTFDI
jgi:hypothetical protein